MSGLLIWYKQPLFQDDCQVAKKLSRDDGLLCCVIERYWQDDLQSVPDAIMCCMTIVFGCHADGTLAERVVLGKRRREQLGIQTTSDRQHQQSSSPRSNIASGAFAGSGPKDLAVAAAPGALDHNGPGRSVGVADSIMQRWGYTEGETCAIAVHTQMHTMCESLGVSCIVSLCVCTAQSLLMSPLVIFSCSLNMCLTVHCSTGLCEQLDSTCLDKFQKAANLWTPAAALSLKHLLATQY